MTDDRPSVAVLREQGPLSLREVTSQTSKRLGCVLMYRDVDAVLVVEREQGHVRIVQDNDDWRERIWEAIPR